MECGVEGRYCLEACKQTHMRTHLYTHQTFAGWWKPIFASPRVNAEDAKNEKELWSMVFEKASRSLLV